MAKKIVPVKRVQFGPVDISLLDVSYRRSANVVAVVLMARDSDLMEHDSLVGKALLGAYGASKARMRKQGRVSHVLIPFLPEKERVLHNVTHALFLVDEGRFDLGELVEAALAIAVRHGRFFVTFPLQRTGLENVFGDNKAAASCQRVLMQQLLDGAQRFGRSRLELTPSVRLTVPIGRQPGAFDLFSSPDLEEPRDIAHLAN